MQSIIFTRKLSSRIRTDRAVTRPCSEPACMRPIVDRQTPVKTLPSLAVGNIQCDNGAYSSTVKKNSNCIDSHGVPLQGIQKKYLSTSIENFFKSRLAISFSNAKSRGVVPCLSLTLKLAPALTSILTTAEHSFI